MMGDRYPGQVRALELKIEEHVHRQAEAGSPTREEFEGLAADLESIWNDDHTDPRLKKRIVRTLIREIVVDVDAQAGEVILVIHWKGGLHTELRLPRRRRGQNNAQTSKAVLDGVRVLARLCSDDLIAGVLNRNGLLTGRGNRWTRERVTALRSHHGIACYSVEQSTGEIGVTASFVGFLSSRLVYTHHTTAAKATTKTPVKSTLRRLARGPCAS